MELIWLSFWFLIWMISSSSSLNYVQLFLFIYFVYLFVFGFWLKKKTFLAESAPAPAAKSSRSVRDPFAFVRGLRKKSGTDGSGGQHPDKVGNEDSSNWSTCSARDFSGTFTGLASNKSRSDHNLHRIIKDDNTWTVFATIRPPAG